MDGPLLRLLPGDGATALDVGAHGGGEVVELGSVFGGKVGGFERVGFEVEEFPGLGGGVFDELPGAAAHGPAGLAHITEVALTADPEMITIEGGLAA